MKTLTTAILAAVVAGCTPGERSDMAGDLPAGSRVYRTSGGYLHMVVPTNINGTDCIIVMKNGGGTAISCNWGKK